MDRSYEFEKLDAIRPRVTFGLFVRNALFLTISIGLFIGALLLSITIIGFIIALPSFALAVAYFQIGRNRAADIKCPNCGSNQEVFVGKETTNHKCVLCKIPLIVTDITEEVPKEDRPKKISQRDREKMRKRERKERKLARKAKRI